METISRERVVLLWSFFCLYAIDTKTTVLYIKSYLLQSKYLFNRLCLYRTPKLDSGELRSALINYWLKTVTLLKYYGPILKLYLYLINDRQFSSQTLLTSFISNKCSKQGAYKLIQTFFCFGWRPKITINKKIQWNPYQLYRILDKLLSCMEN